MRIRQDNTCKILTLEFDTYYRGSSTSYISSFIILFNVLKNNNNKNPSIVQIEYYGTILPTQVFLTQEYEIFISGLYSL